MRSMKEYIMKINDFVEKVDKNQGAFAGITVRFFIITLFIGTWAGSVYGLTALGVNFIVALYALPFAISLYFIIKQLIINQREK